MALQQLVEDSAELQIVEQAAMVRAQAALKIAQNTNEASQEAAQQQVRTCDHQRMVLPVLPCWFGLGSGITRPPTAGPARTARAGAGTRGRAAASH